ncbi:hypothetical protein Vadar_018778 [Vaccinium darrowii]|uniref:Uncharacterized protein n=1 Tax=Vaccinium darrowii TaxID=229202 RepID=A0ACB7X2A4_9ERIC|nr:hypothetical protein Vadar_018778 [Vaccinium darrowii]
MCLARDRDGSNPLHIASARGDLEIVKTLVMVSPQMCLARDRDGNNPLHIAAMKGKVDVLEELIQTGSQRAKVKVDGGNTTLHLCIKYDQFQCLKLLLDKIRDPDFVNEVDANGNTILHLALFDKRWEMIKYVLDKNNCKIDVNAANKSGRTALDIHLLDVGNPADSVYEEIKHILLDARAKLGEEVTAKPSWETKSRGTLMIVASLIATVAFQAGVYPPGGVWQDDSTEEPRHEAGKAILAYKNPDWYFFFLLVNTVGFHTSLGIISLLIALIPDPSRGGRLSLAVAAWLTLIMTTAFAYTYSVIATFPEDKDTNGRSPYTRGVAIGVGSLAWAVYNTLYLLYICLKPWLWERRLKRGGGRPRSLPNEVGGGTQSNLELVIPPPQAAAVS